MPIIDARIQSIYDDIVRRNPGEIEFHQAVKEYLILADLCLVIHDSWFQSRRFLNVRAEMMTTTNA